MYINENITQILIYIYGKDVCVCVSLSMHQLSMVDLRAKPLAYSELASSCFSLVYIYIYIFKDVKTQLCRLQFPCKPCFSMSINKSQCHTLKSIGVDFSLSMFQPCWPSICGCLSVLQHIQTLHIGTQSSDAQRGLLRSQAELKKCLSCFLMRLFHCQWKVISYI